MTQVYSVAVRHPDGSKNLYHMENPANLSLVDLMEVVKIELPKAKVILCAVKPLVPTLKQVN